MAVWSEVDVSAISESFRLDAEYYKPEYLQFEEAAAKGQPLPDSVRAIMHPVEITRIYVDRGIRILLAQNIRPNRLDMGISAYMPISAQAALSRNLLQRNDVVMTRTGANFGDTATFFGWQEPVYACADCLIIRPRNISGAYLATYLNTRIGRGLLDRGAYGAAQPHISPAYLRELTIPRLGDTEPKTEAKVVEAHEKTLNANALYAEAEALLSSALGLDGLDLSPRLFCERPFSDLEAAARCDAEYFSPRTQNLLATLSRDGLTLGDVAKLATRRFTPKAGSEFQYIEIADVTGNGTAEASPVPGEEAPSRATWIVKPGDVITTTVRPIRRLSAIISQEQEGYVCSSGFAVLAPRDVPPELLLVYLRHPLVCELLDLHTTASMYPAISATDLMKIPIALPDKKTEAAIVAKVQDSFVARREARRLLEEAKAMVERAILGE